MLKENYVSTFQVLWQGRKQQFEGADTPVLADDGQVGQLRVGPQPLEARQQSSGAMTRVHERLSLHPPDQLKFYELEQA